MADFSVFLSRSSEKNLERIPSKIGEKIKAALDALKNNPAPAQEYDVTKISGSESNYRIRIGRYHIIYSVRVVRKRNKSLRY